MPEFVRKEDLRLAYIGTPDFAVPCLEALVAGGYRPTVVISQPDRPKGRKQILEPTPVKAAALSLGLDVWQPDRINSPEALEQLQALNLDLAIVAAYGQIFKQQVLQAFRLGCINLHASLLPKYRGASPVQAAILAGDSKTGISIMQMDEGCDTGDVLYQQELVIDHSDTAGSLFDKLAQLGAATCLEFLPDFLAGQVVADRQDDDLASYSGKLTTRSGQIDWNRPARELFNLIRACNPWPGAYSYYQGQRWKIWSSDLVESPAEADYDRAKPGTVVANRQGLTVQTGEGLLCLLEIQPAGKRSLDSREVGHNYPVGSTFSSEED